MVETIDTNAMHLVYLDYSVAQKSCISYFIYKNYEENYIDQAEKGGIVPRRGNL